MLPLYLKEYYKDEPLFSDSKVVTSVYEQSFDKTLNKGMFDKVKFDNIDEATINVLKEPSYNNIMKVAINHSDAIIEGSKELSKEIRQHLTDSGKPVLDYRTPEEFAEPYTEFYRNSVLD